MAPDHEASSDAELLLLVRAGDLDALGALYARHREAGLRVARAVTGDPHLAEDLVATAFERIHRALSNGHGPDDSFRAYLYTVIRRLAAEHGEKKSQEEDVGDWQPFEAATALADQTDGSVESRIVAKAFGMLPERHQAALWYLDVEGMTPAEVAPIFGLSPNAVSALAIRARDGLRDAYVQAHVSDSPVRGECGPTRKLMGSYLRGTLSNRDRAKVDAHLAECDECPAVLRELRDVSGGLRSVFGPILVGGLGLGLGAAAAAGVFGGTHAASATTLAAAPGAGGASGGSAGAAGVAPKHPASAAQRAAVGAVIVMAALAVTTVVSAVASGASAGGDPAAAPPAQSTSAPYPSVPPPSPPVSPSPKPTPKPTKTSAPPPPSKPTTPPPAPVQSPPPTAALDIDLTDDGDDGSGTGGRIGTVKVDVKNTDGSRITATLVVRLPDGVTFDTSRDVTADRAWVCHAPSGSEQTCIAKGVAPGGELELGIPVAIDASALGSRPIADLSISR